MTAPQTYTDGAELRRLRRAAGLTQLELGRHVGLSESAVSRIEGGSRQGHPSHLDALAQVLECDRADLLTTTRTDAP